MLLRAVNHDPGIYMVDVIHFAVLSSNGSLIHQKSTKKFLFVLQNLYLFLQKTTLISLHSQKVI